MTGNIFPKAFLVNSLFKNFAVSEGHANNSDLDQVIESRIGLCDLGVTYSPRDPRFAGSNPAEVDGFFRT